MLLEVHVDGCLNPQQPGQIEHGGQHERGDQQSSRYSKRIGLALSQWVHVAIQYTPGLNVVPMSLLLGLCMYYIGTWTHRVCQGPGILERLEV